MSCDWIFVVALLTAVVVVAVVDSMNRVVMDFDNNLVVKPRFGDSDCCKVVVDFVVEPFVGLLVVSENEETRLKTRFFKGFYRKLTGTGGCCPGNAVRLILAAALLLCGG